MHINWFCKPFSVSGLHEFLEYTIQIQVENWVYMVQSDVLEKCIMAESHMKFIQ